MRKFSRFAVLLVLISTLLTSCKDENHVEGVGTATSTTMIQNATATQNPVVIKWDVNVSNRANYDLEICYTDRGCLAYLAIRCDQEPCRVLDAQSQEPRTNIRFSHTVNNSVENYSIEELAFNHFGAYYSYVRIRMNSGPWIQSR